MKSVIATTLALALSNSAFAQTNIVEQFKNFESNKQLSLVSEQTYKEYDDEDASYCIFKEYTIPASQEKCIETMKAAFEADRAKSYNSFFKSPGASDVIGKIRIPYGEDNEQAITLGTHSDHHYSMLCFADPNDDTMRHAYCFVWFEEGKNRHAYLYHIYGHNPAVKKNIFRFGNQDGEFQMFGKKINTTILDDNTISIETTDDDGNVTTNNINLGKMLSSVGPALNSVYGHLISNDNIETDLDFMSRFGNLRSALLDAIKDSSSQSLSTGLVIKLTDLCKNHSKVLSTEERNTCINCLTEMKRAIEKANPDTFLLGMLQESISSLK